MSHPQTAVYSAVEDHDEWQPHAAEEFQQVGTVGKIATGLLLASTLTHLVVTWSDWNTYNAVSQFLGDGADVDMAILNRADTIARLTSIPNVIVSVAAAVVFVIWLWRARVNSEVFCQADHRRSHGWVLASWFCPGPNLWYPKQIVDDVWLASDPKTPVYADDLRRFRAPLLTQVWWITWVGALAFDIVVRRFLMWMAPSVGTLRGIALAGTASLLLTGVAAVGAMMVIRKINAMQAGREWVPWWDQREPKLTAVPTYAEDDTSEQQPIAEPIATAPNLRLERSPERRTGYTQQPPNQYANETTFGGGAAGANPFNAPAANETTFGGGSGASPFGAAAAGGLAAEAVSGGATGSPFAPAASAPAQDEAPAWSPFAPGTESWQDAGPATEQFSPVETWRDEPGPVEEATPSYQQTAAGLESPSWANTGSYGSTSNDDLLSAPLPSWQAETVAPQSLAAAQPDPYAYQPEPTPVADPEPSWSSTYAQGYSYETSSDYLTSSAPIPAPEPEPEPAPVARAGRRAARVAVDSPSTVQPTEPVYQEPAPQQPSYQADTDDYLTPSKPLPSVPSYGPEPTYTPEPAAYTPEPTYTPEPSYAPEPTYAAYDAPAVPSSYETAYTPDYSSSYTESTYSDYNSSYAPQQPAEPTYESYSSTYDSYSSPSSSQSYSDTSYDYSPNYAPESYDGSSYAPTDYSSTDYTQPAEPDYQAPYSYEPAEPPAADPAPAPADGEDTGEHSAPRTHPRRRWV
ncbi:DUF4328 domain-containing protein [Kribbella sp. DT2]|uniref:DUF4328 domain-containing protein n=1 Tax=Kribbella sp. DT2 TaxID=3393427 RepID=UPI003CE9E5FE